jgi:hypothetical protein
MRGFQFLRPQSRASPIARRFPIRVTRGTIAPAVLATLVLAATAAPAVLATLILAADIPPAVLATLVSVVVLVLPAVTGPIRGMACLAIPGLRPVMAARLSVVTP